MAGAVMSCKVPSWLCLKHPDGTQMKMLGLLKASTTLAEIEPAYMLLFHDPGVVNSTCFLA